MLTPRENFLKMMRRDKPRWIPMDLPCTPPVEDLIKKKTGSQDVVKVFQTDFRGVGVTPKEDLALWRKAHKALGFMPTGNTEMWSYGMVLQKPPPETLGSATHLLEWLHPLASVTDVGQLEKLPWPDMADPKHYTEIPTAVASSHAEGLPITAWRACTVFEDSWYQRGMDNLFGDLIEENGIGDWLLNWFTQRSIHVVTAYARAGADIICLGDDVGTQRGMLMSVDFWRKHLKPRLQRVINAIRNAQREHVWIFYHSDGDMRAVVPDLIEMGIDILNPVQPECIPLAEFIPVYKDQTAFWGMIGTQTTMPFGKPDDVRSAVADCARWARDGAPLIVCPTHVLEPDVPWENIVALAEAVHKEKLW